MRRRRSLVTVLVSLVVVLVSAGGVAAAERPTGPRGTVSATGLTHYVALGDSYTSGPLIPFPRLDPPGCVRSTNNYPSLLARALDWTWLTDVSCGGADTTHMTRPQEVTLGVNPPQFDALGPHTDLVTLGIGGNDHGVFGDVISTCPPLRETDPEGAPCREHFTVDGTDTLLEAIADTGDRVATVLRGARDRAPEATILLVGYPRIAPESGTCPEVLPFADGDYPWLRGVEEALNDALSTAASEVDAATFVDLRPASRGHDACAGAEAWIQGQETDLLAAASYHPRRAGMEGVAEVLRDHLTGAAGATGVSGAE
ncbi:SGNH/GDSL hydrolase family protein [Saccharomonospora saliphila]|uniref:SGNH/GDSL hydrolase family protein n=1 Tax=Saccharomonospora saliphila TaxID=369829 RepID=UPI00037AFB4D|nr:SGNH/GDSL hydrolase family protein [Saccharomonospora saliphila]